MRYIIGIISLLVLIYLVASLIKHRKEKLTWKKGTLVILSLMTMFWGFSSQRQSKITYAGVPITSAQEQALEELKNHETILFYTMNHHQEKLEKINTHADDLKNQQ